MELELRERPANESSGAGLSLRFRKRAEWVHLERAEVVELIDRLGDALTENLTCDDADCRWRLRHLDPVVAEASCRYGDGQLRCNCCCHGDWQPFLNLEPTDETNQAEIRK